MADKCDNNPCFTLSRDTALAGAAAGLLTTALPPIGVGAGVVAALTGAAVAVYRSSN